MSGVVISCCDSITMAKTDTKGKFKIRFPKDAKQLQFSYPGYETFTYHLRKHPELTKKEINLVCDTGDIKRLRVKKNIIAFAPIELINLTTTLQYERSVIRIHSIGILLGLYYNSKQLIYQDPVYTGIKIAPFYRFYAWRNNYNGGFFQVKFLVGYFQLDKIGYLNEDNGFYIHDKFWSFGAGMAWGWAWFPYKKMAMNLSVGFQFFPMKSPNSIEKNGQNYIRGQNTAFLFPKDPWYFGGPGSAIEIKFTIGGIF